MRYVSGIFKKLFVTATACIALSCSKPDLPEATVKEFLKSIDSFEYDKAEAYTTTNYKESLNNIKKASAGWSESQKQEYKSTSKRYEVILKEKTDSVATVFVSSDTDALRMLVLLKKKNGQWLVDKTEDL